jgi:serine/threonine protein kinase
MWGRGTVLGGRYALADRIGGGAMGEVWRAEDQVLERQVAVKLLLPSRFDDDAFTVRFRREAKVLASIDHPGVVAVHDYGENDFPQDDGDDDDDGDSGTRVAYIVMELVEGRSLDDVRAESGVMPVAQALDLVAQALDALHAVHRRGVVHRDIKPSNLMLRGDGRVAVADFGIARVAARTRLTPSHAALGTPLYMAPEQAEGLRVVPASDLYSVGVVCYELLTGTPPFAGDTPVEVALKHIRDPAPDLPAGFPEPVRTFVAKALAKDPEDRYVNAAVMAAAARRAAAGEPPETEPEPVPAPTTSATPEPEPDPEPATGPVVNALATKADRAADAPGWKRRGPVVVLAAVVVPAVTVTVLNIVPLPWKSEARSPAGQPSTSAPANQSPGASPSGSASPHAKASPSSTASAASTGGRAQDANTGVSQGSSADSASGGGSGNGGSGSKPSASSGANAPASTEPTPSAYATPGVSMSDDPKAIAGSEAFAGAGGGCTVWLDNNGSGYLYGMLNTSLYESCNAQLFRSDGLKVSLTARYGAERTTPISDIGHTMWICVWEKGDSVDTRQCSDRFGIQNGTPKAG